jgi:predicted 2-oxoglutarate/Fe(II)-dependent dioxygenase YbiX
MIALLLDTEGDQIHRAHTEEAVTRGEQEWKIIVSWTQSLIKEDEKTWRQMVKMVVQ